MDTCQMTPKSNARTEGQMDRRTDGWTDRHLPDDSRVQSTDRGTARQTDIRQKAPKSSAPEVPAKEAAACQRPPPRGAPLRGRAASWGTDHSSQLRPARAALRGHLSLASLGGRPHPHFPTLTKSSISGSLSSPFPLVAASVMLPPSAPGAPPPRRGGATSAVASSRSGPPGVPPLLVPAGARFCSVGFSFCKITFSSRAPRGLGARRPYR